MGTDRLKLNALLSLLVLSLAGTAFAQSSSLVISPPMKNDRVVLGWQERVMLLPNEILLEAKFAPGSEGNTLHVEKLRTLKRNGKQWAKFIVANRLGGKVELEREMITRTNFRMASGKTIKRPVVKLGVCIAGHYTELDIALGNRKSFGSEIILGRESLAGYFMIDPSLSHVSNPVCSETERNKKDSQSIVQ